MLWWSIRGSESKNWLCVEEVQGVKWCVSQETGFTFEATSEYLSRCVRPVLLYCCETWELTAVDKVRLRRVERCMIRMMYGVRLVDRVSTDVFRDRVGVVVKIEDMIIQSCLRWYGHAMCGDINSQIREVMEAEITGKKKKGRPRKLWEECIKKDLERYGLRREDAYDRNK